MKAGWRGFRTSVSHVPEKAVSSGFACLAVRVADYEGSQGLIRIGIPQPQPVAYSMGGNDKVTTIGPAHIRYDGRHVLDVGKREGREPRGRGVQYDGQRCCMRRPYGWRLRHGRIRVEGKKATPIGRQSLSAQFAHDVHRIAPPLRDNADDKHRCGEEIPAQSPPGHGDQTI